MVAAPNIAMPRTKTSDRMLTEIATVECGPCRAILGEMQEAVSDDEDSDCWWREMFKLSMTTINNGNHVHCK